ncbi:hypothetical protein RIF29_07040 [Crotalaria pallida]|uniref:Uncharacterized protein n=1 Tax=Crotalaria pallida TaxID=3830 RepID=A0AAN9J3R3_CROPI
MVLGLVLVRVLGHSLEMELHDLVTKMKRGGLSEFCYMDSKKLRGKEKDLSFIYEYLNLVILVPMASDSDDVKNDHTLFCYASWCKFPSFEADFGWGKPVWVTTQ